MIAKYREGDIPQAGPEGEALPAVAAEGEAMVRAAAAHFDAVEITAALEAIWEFVRRLNRLVEEEAPWKLAKDEAQAGRLDAVLRALAAGLRLIALSLYPVVPDTAVEILRRLGQPHGDADLLLARADVGRARGGGRRGRRRRSSRASRAAPERRGRAAPGAPGWRRLPRRGTPARPTGPRRLPLPPRVAARTPRAISAAAWQAGLEAVVAIGFDLDSSRQAVGLRAPARARARRPWACTRTRRTRSTTRCSPGSRSWPATPKVVAVGECGLDYYRDHCPRDAQRRAFSAQIELARRAGLPLVVHTREAADDTMAVLTEEAAGLTVVMHCFSLPDHVDECNARGYYASFAGNVTYKNAGDLRAAAARVRDDLLLVETDAPYLTPVPYRGKPNRPGLGGGDGGGRGRGARLDAGRGPPR